MLPNSSHDFLSQLGGKIAHCPLSISVGEPSGDANGDRNLKDKGKNQHQP
ncbi:hypothetical protein [Leptolyngbya ohadii]|nr:hypothetical protein [Leptolyngbya ohadii]